MNYPLLIALLFAFPLQQPPDNPDVPGGRPRTRLQQPSTPANADAAPAARRALTESVMPDVPPTVRSHSVTLNGQTLRYTTTTGFLPIHNATGETEANIFYVAYTKQDVGAGEKRPLLFAFNGGPGSASLWLHLGAIGPRRVQLLEDGGLPPPPYQMVDNEATWLDRADLVFIDPVGTGYSRPTKPELGPKFWSVQGDLDSVGEFIRLYLSRNQRWDSPLFVAGESYGTTRAAGLSNWLLSHGIALNGVILMSSVLNFQTLNFAPGNDLPYALYLPTYTASAWYHHKLPASEKNLSALLADSEKWATNEYPSILAKGDSLTPSEREQALNHLVRYTGLDKRYLDEANLRVSLNNFTKELLRDQRRTLGRYDSRLKGIDESGVSAFPDYDPSYAAVAPPFTTLFNQYVRADLGYQSDAPYHVLGDGLTAPWNWGPGGRNGTNLSGALRSALVQNPYMKVFVAAGRYDLATPFFEARYTLDHLNLEPALRHNLTFAEYEAGHMMYIDTTSRHKLKSDFAAWFDTSLSSASTVRKTP